MPRYTQMLAALLAWACVSGLARADTPVEKQKAGLISSRIDDRVLKAFDFDEQEFGNYEAMPRGWRQIREPGFPRFLTPRFDYEIGHDAPPSFRFALAGGNLGASYLARDIDVHPHAEYHVSGWIRVSGLIHAKASLTACYMDHAFRKIPESERRSAHVTGSGQDEAWTKVSIHLPAGSEKARWIGLYCVVEQSLESAWHPDKLRPIDYRDVRATAWFDDIVVLRLPRAGLEFSAVGNVFEADQPIECEVRVADVSVQSVAAKLEIIDAQGSVLQERAVPVVGMREAGVRLRIGDLPAGWYKAVLSVDVGEGVVLTREQSFLRLNPDLPGSSEAGHGFGIILDSPAISNPRVCERLLSAAACGAMKIPLWRRELDDAAVLHGDSSLNELLRRLQDEDLMLVGVLEEPPDSLARLCGHPKLSLLDVLSRPPEQWRPYLAFVSAHYGRQFAAWQIGAEAAAGGEEGPRLAAALANVRAELKPLIGSAELAVPQNFLATEGATVHPEAGIVSVRIPPHAVPTLLTKRPAGSGGSEGPRKWAVIEPLPAGRYGRLTRLSELARAMIAARIGGFQTVFIQQPWSVGVEASDTAMSVAEDLIVLRTLAQTLGGLEPVESVWIDHGLRAWLFADAEGTNGAVVAWAKGDGAAASVPALFDLGPEARQIDPWGNLTATEPASGGRALLIGTIPTIISPVEPSRVRMLASFGLTGPDLQAVIDKQQRTVTLSNPRSSRLSGTLSLAPPAGWRIEPSRATINLAPGEQAHIDVDVILPVNQAAGEFALAGRLSLDETDAPTLVLKAPLTVASPGLDVTVLTRREGRTLEVFQRITNRTQENLNLRGLLIAPSSPRQTQVVTNLPPGDTAVRRYTVHDAASVVGRPIRVSAEQVDGPLRHNALIVPD